MLKPDDEPVPGYRLKKFLGKGQFGEVWMSTSPGKTHVALKFLNVGRREGRKEFRAIQRVKSIRHANLTPVISLWLLDEAGNVLTDDAMEEIGTDSTLGTLNVSTVGVEMEKPSQLVVAQLLGDKTLGQRLEECQQAGEQGIPLKELLPYIEEAAKGIDYLNECRHVLDDKKVSIQHCDVKPANMLLIGDSVQICDYGVAQIIAAAKDSTRAKSPVGSPAYISPECSRQMPSSHSDQYSLAISYYELRTGTFPFTAENAPQAIDAHQKGALSFDAVDKAERRVLQKATSLNPKRRYSSCLEMVRELRLAADAKGFNPRRQVMAAMAAVVVALIFAGLVYFWPRGIDEHTLNRIQERLSEAESALENDAGGERAQRLIRESLADIPPGETLDETLMTRASLLLARAEARQESASPEAILEQMAKINTTVLTSDSQRAHYAALQARFSPWNQNLRAFAEIKLHNWQTYLSAPDAAGMTQAKTALWESIYNGEFPVDPTSEEKQLVENIWPDSRQLVQLLGYRTQLASATDPANVAEISRYLAAFINSQREWLRGSSEGHEQLRRAFEQLEFKLDTLGSDPELAEPLENLLAAMARMDSPNAGDQVTFWKSLHARCWLARSLLFENSNDDTLANVIGDPPLIDTQNPLEAALLVEWLLQRSELPDVSVPMASIENALANPDVPFASYLHYIVALNKLRQGREPELADVVNHLSVLQRESANQPGWSGCRRVELLAEEMFNAAERLVTPMWLEGSGTNAMDSPLAQSAGRWPTMWNVVEQTVRNSATYTVRWKTIRWATSDPPLALENNDSLADRLQIAATLLNALRRRGGNELDLHKVYERLIQPAVDNTPIDNVPEPLKTDLAYVIFERGNILDYELDIEDDSNRGQLVRDSFATALRLVPDHPDYLFHCCRSIQDPFNYQVQPSTSQLVDDVWRTLKQYEPSQGTKARYAWEGWHGWAALMASRLMSAKSYSKQRELIDLAITSFDYALSDTGEDSQRRPTWLGNRSTARVELGFTRCRDDRESIYIQARDDALAAIAAATAAGMPPDPRRYIALGNALEDLVYYADSKQTTFDEALAAFQQAIELDRRGRYPNAHTGWARCQVRGLQTRWQKAQATQDDLEQLQACRARLRSIATTHQAPQTRATAEAILWLARINREVINRGKLDAIQRRSLIDKTLTLLKTAGSFFKQSGGELLGIWANCQREIAEVHLISGRDIDRSPEQKSADIQAAKQAFHAVLQESVAAREFNERSHGWIPSDAVIYATRSFFERRELKDATTTSEKRKYLNDVLEPLLSSELSAAQRQRVQANVRILRLWYLDSAPDSQDACEKIMEQAQTLSNELENSCREFSVSLRADLLTAAASMEYRYWANTKKTDCLRKSIELQASVLALFVDPLRRADLASRWYVLNRREPTARINYVEDIVRLLESGESIDEREKQTVLDSARESLRHPSVSSQESRELRARLLKLE